VIDGEIVAVDAEGRPSFQLLQKAAVGAVPTVYFVFDVMGPGRPERDGRAAGGAPAISWNARCCRRWPRRCGTSNALDAELSVLIQSVHEQHFEGLVAKRRDSRYEPGRRSGAWQKMRINQGKSLSSAATPSARGRSTR
jgi:bifunctional non-homologous end joining protein LigD